MFSASVRIRENRSLYWAGIIQLVYGLVELADVATVTMMSIGLVPNIYETLIPVTTEVHLKPADRMRP